MSEYGEVRKLVADDCINDFDCGVDELNQFLKRYALFGQQSNSAQTYVVHHNKMVVGYYSLAVGGVSPDAAPKRIIKGLARHAVPVMILARLAVDRTHQNQGLGSALLKNALLRTAQAAEVAGIRAVLVHAKDEDACQWYQQWEFELSPTDNHHLFLLMKDLIKLLGT